MESSLGGDVLVIYSPEIGDRSMISPPSTISLSFFVFLIRAPSSFLGARYEEEALTSDPDEERIHSLENALA